MNDLVAMARAAQRDERLSDGALYGKLADEIERLYALSPPEPTEGLRAHKIMTSQEYRDLNLKGWHMVCRDYDGPRSVGIRYTGDQTGSMPLQDHGWQPINTAPKDGSVIQLFVPDDDDGDVVWPAHWTLPAAKNHLGAWKHCTAGRWVAEDSDQRWRPLAAPPMVAEQGTKS